MESIDERKGEEEDWDDKDVEIMLISLSFDTEGLELFSLMEEESEGIFPDIN